MEWDVEDFRTMDVAIAGWVCNDGVCAESYVRVGWVRHNTAAVGAEHDFSDLLPLLQSVIDVEAWHDASVGEDSV